MNKRMVKPRLVGGRWRKKGITPYKWYNPDIRKYRNKNKEEIKENINNSWKVKDICYNFYSSLTIEY